MGYTKHIIRLQDLLAIAGVAWAEFRPHKLTKLINELKEAEGINDQVDWIWTDLIYSASMEVTATIKVVFLAKTMKEDITESFSGEIFHFGRHTICIIDNTHIVWYLAEAVNHKCITLTQAHSYFMASGYKYFKYSVAGLNTLSDKAGSRAFLNQDSANIMPYLDACIYIPACMVFISDKAVRKILSENKVFLRTFYNKMIAKYADETQVLQALKMLYKTME